MEEFNNRLEKVNDLVKKCYELCLYLKQGLYDGYYEEVTYINDNEVDVKVDYDMIILNDHQYVVDYWDTKGGANAIAEDFVKALEY